MGKKGANSWFSAVKKAFRSPTKDKDRDKTTGKTSRRREENDEHNEEEKKREKRRWMFRKPSNQETVIVTTQQPRPELQPQPQLAPQCEAETIKTSVATAQTSATAPNHLAAYVNAEQRHAVEVAMATAAAAEAVVVTAQAAAEVVRLTTATRRLAANANFIRRHYAAIVIQTAFRGYLARRALAALRGLVKLQALVRGRNVRKQAQMTLKCMQALVHVQARVHDQRMRLSQDGSRNSTISDLDRLFINSRDGSRVGGGGDWDDCPHTLEEIQAMLENRKEAAAAAALSLKREKALSHAFSQQIWRCEDDPSEEEEFEENPKWLDHDQWMVMKPWQDRRRASTDQREQQHPINIRTVEIDTYRPYTHSSTPTIRNSQQQSYSHSTIGSPLHREGVQHHRLSLNNSPVPATPSTYKTRPSQVHSVSPRQCLREEERYNDRRNHTNTQTPLSYSGAAYYYNEGDDTDGKPIPSYMAATESAKARIRSQSVPRQRAPLTPERDGGGCGGGLGSAKKRLSFPDVPNQDPYNRFSEDGGVRVDVVGDEGRGGVVKHGRHSRKSPSFKRWSGNGNSSDNEGGRYYVVGGGEFEQQSNLSSCCTDGEISPSSTSYLRMRRWLR